jgi:hypothetical protein
MTPRFQRGKTGAISPFFAFQDIITSAMAVLIAIIMLLALYMGGAALHDSEERESAALAARLSSVLDRLAAAQEDIRDARESVNAEKADPALLQGQIEILRRELAAVRGDAKSRENVASEIRDDDSAIRMRRELNGKRAENAKAAEELQKAETEAAHSLREMESLETSVKIREAALLEEEARRNQLWVVPDRSASSKEPILAVISQNEASFQRFDNPEKQTLNGPGVTDGFSAMLKNYSPRDQYLVLYFKPSGAVHFKQLTREAKDAGFEIGYDAINEDVEVNFKTPK